MKNKLSYNKILINSSLLFINCINIYLYLIFFIHLCYYFWNILLYFKEESIPKILEWHILGKFVIMIYHMLMIDRDS